MYDLTDEDSVDSISDPGRLLIEALENLNEMCAILKDMAEPLENGTSPNDPLYLQDLEVKGLRVKELSGKIEHNNSEFSKLFNKMDSGDSCGS